LKIVTITAVIRPCLDCNPDAVPVRFMLKQPETKMAAIMDIACNNCGNQSSRGVRWKSMNREVNEEEWEHGEYPVSDKIPRLLKDFKGEE